MTHKPKNAALVNLETVLATLKTNRQEKAKELEELDRRIGDYEEARGLIEQADLHPGEDPAKPPPDPPCTFTKPATD